MHARHVRGLGFVAALVVFGIGIALLLRQGGGGEGAEFESSASAPEDVEAGTEAPREDLNGSGSSDASRAALAANEGEAPAVIEVREPGVELVPIVGVHRRRVAPVEVWWWQPKDPDNWQELGQLERWIESGVADVKLAELARQLEPDELGAFHAPEPYATGCVAARGEGLWGWTRVQRSSPDPTYIPLETDETLRVRVLDASGAAAPGVRVALRQRWKLTEEEELGSAGDLEFAVDRALVVTGPEGTALFPHFRALMKDHWDFDARCVVAVAEPFATVLEHELEPTRPPDATVEFQLPPSGGVVLEVGGSARGALYSLEMRDAGASNAADSRASSEDFLRAAQDGVVRFPWVGLGLFITPTSRVEGKSRTHEESAALGPTRAGEVRTLRLEVKPNEALGARLVGTLVGPAIRSIGTTRVDVAIDAHDPDDAPWKQFLRVAVTADGRFMVPLQREIRGTASLEFTVRGPRDERVGIATAKALGRAGLLELEVGEVFVDSLPLLVSGQVVDAAGRRAVGAEVTVWGRRADGGNGWNGGWERSANLRTYTGFSGDFEVRGVGEWTALGMAAWNADGASEFEVVGLGTAGVVLTLGANGGIAGSVVLGSGLAREYTIVNVRREGTNVSPQGSTPYRRSEIDAEGAFVVRGLAPGSYTVSVETAGTPETVAAVEGVLVEAGRLTRDSRLDPLNLGHWSELRVLDSEGELAIDANAYLIERGSSRWSRQRLTGGKFVYEHGTAPLWVIARRHLLARFDPASRATTLQLERAPSVQVRVPGELVPSIASAEFRLSFRSSALPPSIARIQPDSVEIRDALSQPFALRQLPSFSTTLFVTGTEGSIELPHELSGSVSAQSRTSPQVLELRWKPEDLAEALERSRR